MLAASVWRQRRGSLSMTTARPSYVHGASNQPLLGDTVGALLDRVAAAYPERPALVARAQGVRLSYRQFHAEVERVAAGLLALGLERGDRVGIWAPNRAEWVVLQFAAPKAGLILVNINPAYRTHELEYSLNKVACSALVLPRRFKTSHYLEILGELAPELASSEPGRLQAARLPALREVILLGDEPAPGTRRWAELAALADAAALARLHAAEPTLGFDDPVNIQFTSGTTGAPKGATLTHHNIVNHGACMVIPGEGFDPLVTLKTVAEEKCTSLHGVPTMFIAELEHPRFAEFDLSSLRTGIMAGSPCPIEVMRRVVREMHMDQVTIAYGMTETSPVSFQTVPEDPLERRVDSVGRIHPHLEVKLVGEHGEVVPRGTPGELCTRGYSVMLGYWNDDLRTREAIDEARWMHTGDLAVIDADGYCSIVGRLKDMIIRGGENVYPREIEEFLYTHPKIQDVQVFGVPDAKFGEQVCAWIRLREGSQATEAEIQDYCRHHLAYYKVPHYVRFVEAFPMTVTGKVQKYLMRDAMTDELAPR